MLFVSCSRCWGVGVVLVSVDFEGLPYVVSRLQLGPEGRLWGDARRVASRLVGVVARVLVERGYGVVVADSHGLMVNLDVSVLPRGVRVVSGFPRVPPSMVPLVDGVVVAVFLGYHAGGGVWSVLSHTYAGRYVVEVRVNGVRASEYLLNALYLGEKGVPVGLVAGSEELMGEVERFTPWAERVVLKKSLGYYAAVSPSLPEIEEALVAGVERMVERLEGGLLRPLEPERPVRLEIVHTSPLYADITSLIPGARRRDGVRVELEAGSMEEALRLLELALYAWVGARAVTGG